MATVFFTTAARSTVIHCTEEEVEVMDEAAITLPLDDQYETVTKVRVVGVSSLGSFRGCIKCSSKVLYDDGIGECPKCSLVQLEEDGKTCYMGSLIVDIGGKRVDVRAYDQVLADIAGVGAECVTAKGLLKCGCFDMVYKDGIIRSAKRK